jgi:hypothetical protein
MVGARRNRAPTLYSEGKMARDSATDNDPQGNDTPQPAVKLVISSVLTHAKLLDMIKERNPIIASRDQPKR